MKKVITDEDLLGLVSDNMDTADAVGWEVVDLHVSSCSRKLPGLLAAHGKDWNRSAGVHCAACLGD